MELVYSNATILDIYKAGYLTVVGGKWKFTDKFIEEIGNV